ncbi:MAG: YggS family pyridoxal phosphate-dependent enzyme [Alphaproteobacteria bacterium]
MPVDPVSIAQRLAAVRNRIEAAAADSGRPAGAVTLVAVAKTAAAEAVAEACAAGQRVFGENRVQEAAAKYPGLRARFADLRLHLIGPLQTNKVRQAVGLFDVIESVDRPRLARAIAAACATDGRAPEILVQVNVGREPQKAGAAPEEAGDLIRLCRDELGLPLRGLMCIPPADAEPAPFFAFLAELGRRHGLPWLSMGMSGDYEIAIQQGATHVRVGSAIFGPRPPAGGAGAE